MSFEWTEDLATGVDVIDEQHRELFRRTARLLDGLKKGEPEQIDGLVRFLYEYVVMHFGTEEQLMRSSGYRGYARHKAEHDRFVSELIAFSGDREHMGSGAFMALKLNHWLAQWLKEHVSGTDAELGRHLARRTG
ncbi:MAG TPA: bacteriohemerythrin [Anaeromyxobacter sp.]|nr:bacteriohemerythrin [Anaeromyxobacter sp.]